MRSFIRMCCKIEGNFSNYKQPLPYHRGYHFVIHQQICPVGVKINEISLKEKVRFAGSWEIWNDSEMFP